MVMYDYVLQYGFDDKTQNDIQDLKKYLKENNVKDTERNWLPHITIDLYNCKNENEFINTLNTIIGKIKKFKIQCENLNDFDKQTLYIEPFNKDNLISLKEIFNKELDDYRLDNRRERPYTPHITLCTNDNIDEQLYKLANERFTPFVAEIKYIWVYRQNMELVKQYELK